MIPRRIGLPARSKKIRAARDCIHDFANKVTSAQLLKQADLEGIDREVEALIDDAVHRAKAAPQPDRADLLTDVYVSY